MDVEQFGLWPHITLSVNRWVWLTKADFSLNRMVMVVLVCVVWGMLMPLLADFHPSFYSYSFLGLWRLGKRGECCNVVTGKIGNARHIAQHRNNWAGVWGVQGGLDNSCNWMDGLWNNWAALWRIF